MNIRNTEAAPPIMNALYSIRPIINQLAHDSQLRQLLSMRHSQINDLEKHILSHSLNLKQEIIKLTQGLKNENDSLSKQLILGHMLGIFIGAIFGMIFSANPVVAIIFGCIAMSAFITIPFTWMIVNHKSRRLLNYINNLTFIERNIVTIAESNQSTSRIFFKNHNQANPENSVQQIHLC